MSLSEKLFYNFSRLFHCSIIKVLATRKPYLSAQNRLFSLLPLCCFFTASANIILSDNLLLVNTFFNFFILLFKVSVASTSYILSNGSTFVNTFFHVFCIFYFERFSNLNHDKKRKKTGA